MCILCIHLTGSGAADSVSVFVSVGKGKKKKEEKQSLVTSIQKQNTHHSTTLKPSDPCYNISTQLWKLESTFRSSRRKPWQDGERGRGEFFLIFPQVISILVKKLYFGKKREKEKINAHFLSQVRVWLLLLITLQCSLHKCAKKKRCYSYQCVMITTSLDVLKTEFEHPCH